MASLAIEETITATGPTTSARLLDYPGSMSLNRATIPPPRSAPSGKLKSTVRSRAPLRLGLAGGASDVSPFCDRYGGYVLNATIQMFAHAHLQPLDNGSVEFVALDYGKVFSAPLTSSYPLEGDLILHKAVYNRMVNEFNEGCPLSLRLLTVSDAPAGSGLGASSTLVVAIVQAYVEWLSLPLGDYEIARLAFQIEREDAKLLGGRQDQYAATFGGFNFMEFYAEERVIVNPLRVRNAIVHELEASTVLYYTGVSRESANLIEEQQTRVVDMQSAAIEATMELKQDAVLMKEALLRADFPGVARVLGRSWEAKKRLASKMTNPTIETAYAAALEAGAIAGRISGAGGGGFIIFVVDPVKKHDVVGALKKCGGQTFPCLFGNEGVQSWRL